MPSNDPTPEAKASELSAAAVPDDNSGAFLPADVQLPPQPTQQSPVSSRYQVIQAVAGDMHIARDRLLDRSVHVRLADSSQADELEREARFVARLEHAGVMPIHDFVRSDGGAMMVLHNPEGVSLATAIAESLNGSPRSEMATTASIVQIMIRVCDTLAAAHARGVLHRNLTTDSIILGWQGQILVGKWHVAMNAIQRPMTMRYVSAENAPATPPLEELQIDLSATGACLFEALALRALKPTTADPIGDLSSEERRRVPSPLEAIIRKAMTGNVVNGYQSISALRHDLELYAAGVPSDAYDPGLSRRLQAWIYRKRRALLTTLAALAAIAVIAVLVQWQIVEHQRRWGVPIVHETFSDDSWRERWVEMQPNSFEAKNGLLVSTAAREAVLVYRHRLKTPVAIEYTGRIAPGSRPCDLSVLWSERWGELTDPAKLEDGARLFMIQAGAYDNSFFAIHRRPDLQRLAYANRQLEVNRAYRFRVEIENDVISMSIDGERVLEYHELIPSTSGYISLYGYYPGKNFSDVSIFQKVPSHTVSPVATGDTLFQFEHYAEAASVYGRIAEVDPDSTVGQEALYRKGLAERRMGRADLSRVTWSAITDPHFSELTKCLLLEELLTTWQIDVLISRFEEQYRASPGVQSNLRLQWQQLLSKMRRDPRRDDATLLRFLAVREHLFPTDNSSSFEAGNTFLDMGRYVEVLDRFRDEKRICATALLALGRCSEILKAKWTLQSERNAALIMMGDFQQVLASPDTDTYTRAYVMCKMGQAETAFQATQEYYPCLIHLGRAGEVLNRPQFWNTTNDALLALGRYAEAANRSNDGDWRACILLGRIDDAERMLRQPIPWARLLVAAEKGASEEIGKIRPDVRLPLDLSAPAGWFPGVVIGPFIDRLQGDKDALDKSLNDAIRAYPAVFSKKAWFFARAVLGQGAEGEILSMPTVTEAQAWRLLAKALSAELHAQPAEARSSYRAFTALPLNQRLLDANAPDPAVECFVAWRLRELGIKATE